MTNDQKTALEQLTGEGIRFDYPMHRLTTYKVGGPVEALWEARELEKLKKFIRYLCTEDIPYGVLGNGSNLLVKDKGIDGVMILLSGSLAVIKDNADKSLIWAGGGVHLADLMNWCRQHGRSGLEFLAGIPGTVGGAVVMNAGAFGKEIHEKIKTLQFVLPGGTHIEMKRSELKFSYRRLHMEEGQLVTNACFRLNRATPKAVSEKMSGFLRTRKQTQPLEYPSAGSVFKNPPDTPRTGEKSFAPTQGAGRLIEKAGLKGKTIGGAMVSEKHANYIVNKGGATASDILSLMDLVRLEVKRTAGIDLEPEIRVLGK
ncbi:MAG: UDP-N-acetylenolpyruvoylglucosamine reductase [Desulfobacteraceae bacterium 4572_87]|nr:MAG: UDP-N-acetylenolpyruvoylglucosamine reductase [Desulfobacteraceae bacterium 4572_87]